MHFSITALRVSWCEPCRCPWCWKPAACRLQHSRHKTRGAGHCLMSLMSPALLGDGTIHTWSLSLQNGYMIHRLATSLSNENTQLFFILNLLQCVFDWFQSELHISGAQQKQTSQINQCLFVAQRGLLHFCFGHGFYLEGSHETNRALQILIIISFSVFHFGTLKIWQHFPLLSLITQLYFQILQTYFFLLL